MKKMKKLLSAVLALAMMLSMIVLPVSAEEAREQFHMSDDKQFVLESGAQAHYYLSALLDGYGILYDSGNASYSISICDADGNSVKLHDWNEGSYVGYGFKVEEGKTYNIDISNNTGETVSYNVHMWLAESYGDLTMSQTAYAGNAQTTVNLTVSSETAMAFEPITWTSSDPDVAEIGTGSNMNRVIDLLAPGTATVTATTASGLIATCEVTVKKQETIIPGETKSFTLDANQGVFFNFVPTESGKYIVYVPANTCYFGVAVGDDYVTGSEVSAGYWESDDSLYWGLTFEAEAGKNYVIKAINDLPSVSMDIQLTLVNADAMVDENTPKAIAPGETKNFTLEHNQQETFLFTPAESGRYIAYYPVNSYYADLYEGTSMDNATQVLPDNWQDAEFKYQGQAFDAEAGKTYLIRAVNWWSETPIDCQLFLMKAANYETFEIEWDVSGLVGDEVLVNVNFAPENASEAVTWTSSDESIVAITNTNGTEAELRLVGSGTATVTATSASGKKASCTVTVSQELSIALGETVELTLDTGASAYYNFAPAETGRYILTMPADRLMDIVIFDENIGWKSGDIWMNGDGTKAGYAFDLNAGIGYSMEVYNNYSETVSLTLTLVKAGNFDSIRFPKTSYSGYLGGFLTLALIGSPEYADETITWTSSNNDVAYIEYADGVMADIILADIGTATITATTAGGKKATCTVTVKDMIELIKDKPVSAKIGMGETAVCYFEAPSSGTYSLYAAGEGYSECVVFDGRTGMVLNGDYWYQNGAEGADYVMTAGGVYLIYVVNMSDADINCSIGIGQRTKATGMYFAEESGTVYRGVQLMLEPYFKPVLAQREDVTWTTGNSDIVKFSRKYEEGPYVSYYFDAISAGTTTVTAKSAGGFTAKYTVTVLEPEDLELGEHLTPEMDGWDFVVYNIIPETSGKHFIRWTDSDKTHVQLWHPTKEFDGRNYMDGDEEVIEAELTAGEEYFLLFQNMTEDARSFEFRLEGAPHVHAPELVTEKTATFTEDGVKAHYACACGALFADEAGAVEITASDILIPKQIQVESGKAEVGKDAVNDAAQNIEKGGEVSIPVADVSEDAKSAALPVESLTRIAEKEALLTVEMPAAAVTMDTAALETVAEKAGDHASVTLEVAEIPREDLTETQMAAIKELDRNLVTAISAELLVNGQNIATKADSGFGGGKVTVKIPVKLSGDFTVLYIADDGSVEVIGNAAYENGVLTMELEHFSTYAILQDSQPGDVNDDGAINVLDLMYLANYFAKGEVINKANADVNADGALNVLDLMYLANFFAGKETTLG